MGYKGIFDFVFFSCNKKAMSSKEDAYAYDLSDRDYGYISVFDGCGGLGSRKYRIADNRTGAYLAARAACSAVDGYFQSNKGPVNSSGVKRALIERLKELKSKADDGAPELMGSMVKSFPTTMAMGSVWKSSTGIEGKFLWAGDSRGYILDENGLRQITVDDIENEEDAFENIVMDSQLSNLVHISGDFKLNEKAFKITKPSIILVATDGVFNYLPSPMHFEQMLYETMFSGKSIAEWEKAIETKLIEISGDDATLVMTGCMMDMNYAKLKQQFKKRKEYLDSLLQDKTERGELEKIWKTQYKAAYEGKR